MGDTLAAWGIKVVALSRDTVEVAAAHHARDQLSMTLLADPEFQVIDALGLRHRKGIHFVTKDFLGLPMGYPAGFQDMAIPTTLLLDEAGVVRWIDQADDYRIRGDEARIVRACEQVFGPRPEASSPTSDAS